MLGLLRDLEPRATAMLPSISELRDQLREGDAERVAAYLRAGNYVCDTMEIVSDPLDPSVGIPGGSGLQSDGEWVWRQDLEHYVLRYRIGLPDEFLARALTGHPPPLPLSLVAAAMKTRDQALRSGTGRHSPYQPVSSSY